MSNPHPHFEKLKTDAWEAFINKDYEKAAITSANILQDSYSFDALHVAGLSLVNLDRIDEGFEFLVASLSLSKPTANWYANAAVAFLNKKDYVRAMLFVSNGVEAHPDDLRLDYMQGMVMCHAQEWDRALEYLHKTMEKDPEFYHAVMSIGFCHHMRGEYQKAIDCYESIMGVADGDNKEEIVNNYACVYMELGEQDKALAILEKEFPNSVRPGTLYNKSFLYLGMGRWPEGWHLYRNRSLVQVNGDQGLPIVDQPTAQNLEELINKNLFLFHEQGMGDSLQFIRYAEKLRPYVNSLVIGVPKSIRRLAEHLVMDGDFQIVSDAETEEHIYGKCDIALPMLDAPAILNSLPETVPCRVPYFKIPQEIIDKHQLPDTCKPRIGLVWAGAARKDNIRAHSIDKRRSVPFAMLEPILQLSDRFEFVSLQLPDHYVEDRRLLQPLSVGDGEPGFRDVLDTAGFMMQIDLLISIDSSMAHLAGALGKPVWLLSRLDACWRWFWPKSENDWTYENTIWYENMKIYRQKSHHSWPEVISRVAKDLAKMTDLDLSSKTIS